MCSGLRIIESMTNEYIERVIKFDKDAHSYEYNLVYCLTVFITVTDDGARLAVVVVVEQLSSSRSLAYVLYHIITVKQASLTPQDNITQNFSNNPNQTVIAAQISVIVHRITFNFCLHYFFAYANEYK